MLPRIRSLHGHVPDSHPGRSITSTEGWEQCTRVCIISLGFAQDLARLTVFERLFEALVYKYAV